MLSSLDLEGHTFLWQQANFWQALVYALTIVRDMNQHLIGKTMQLLSCLLSLHWLLQNATADIEQPLTMGSILSEQSGSGKHARKHIFGGGRSQAAAEPVPLPGHESQPESLAKRECAEAELEASNCRPAHQGTSRNVCTHP